MEACSHVRVGTHRLATLRVAVDNGACRRAGFATQSVGTVTFATNAYFTRLTRSLVRH